MSLKLDPYLKTRLPNIKRKLTKDFKRKKKFKGKKTLKKQ